MSIQNFMPDFDSESKPTCTPPGEYQFNVAFDNALRVHDSKCASCRCDLEPGDALFRNVWHNDNSARSTVPLCYNCESGEWRPHVRERRLEDAGRVRGWLIKTLWPYSTTKVRFVSQLLAEFAVLVVLTLAIVFGGHTETVVAPLSAYPIGGAVAVAVAYLCHHALWVHRDPRGYVRRSREPWVWTAVAVGVGVASLGATLVFEHPLVTVGAWVLAGAALVGMAHELGLAVRRDRSDVIVEPDRTLVVGGTRALTIVALAGLALYAGTWVAVALAVLPFVAAAGYVVYRAPHDTTLQRQLRTIRDEIDDLLNGGTY